MCILRCGKAEHEKCDVTQALTGCHLLSDEVPVTSTLLRPEYHLNVERLARHTYRLLNRSAPQLPFIAFEIPRSSSILRSVYPPSTVKDDRTLAAQLIRRDHEWILHVEGELQSCPGQLTCRFFSKLTKGNKSSAISDRTWDRNTRPYIVDPCGTAFSAVYSYAFNSSLIV